LTEVPVIEQAGLSETEARAARIADNRVAESDWNDDLLALEFDLLGDADEELPTGFDSDERDDIIEPDDMEPPDSFEEIDDEEIETEHECPECGYEW
jgi:hypothetical protein